MDTYSDDILELKRLFPIARSYRLAKIRLEALNVRKRKWEKDQKDLIFQRERCLKNLDYLKKEEAKSLFRRFSKFQIKQIKIYETNIAGYDAELGRISSELEKLYEIMYGLNCFVQDNFYNFKSYNALFQSHQNLIRDKEAEIEDALYDVSDLKIKAERCLNTLNSLIEDCGKLQTTLSKARSHLYDAQKFDKFDLLSPEAVSEAKKYELIYMADEALSVARMMAESISAESSERIRIDFIVTFENDNTLTERVFDKLFPSPNNTANYKYDVARNISHVEGYIRKTKRVLEALKNEKITAEYEKIRTETDYIRVIINSL